MVDLHVVYGNREWLEGMKHHDFSADLVKDQIGSRQRMDVPDPTRAPNSSSHHRHGGDESCYSGMNEKAKNGVDKCA